ncbi:MAG TPA: ribbon-helix-helix domain-containing protein [Chloroflexota bacterium]|jgi:Arc/MetJ-type ribon-helix-helix transcriptional regulator|nr:ribbon-helix-helix domain-containing protein [Chloroflexota bacterium]
MRTHVVLPDDLVREIDREVGKRGRSQFLAEAARARLRGAQLRKYLESGEPVLDRKETPGWATPEMASAWVSALRRGKWWDPAKEPPDWWTDYRPDA